MLRSLVDKLLAPGTSYASRRGAAFGLAGCVRGYNLSVLKAQGVMARLEEACVGTVPEGRLGALMGFECLCRGLGMLFEPYVTRILPLLLKTFGDSSGDVREAAQVRIEHVEGLYVSGCLSVRRASLQETSKAVMSILTGHGMKLVLPAVLAGLSESAWRSKQAGISMLGNMAFCAPKQLGQCLPQIVPRLVEAFDDPHPRVQASGKDALQQARVRRDTGAPAAIICVCLSFAGRPRDQEPRDPAARPRAALRAR